MANAIKCLDINAFPRRFTNGKKLVLPCNSLNIFMGYLAIYGCKVRTLGEAAWNDFHRRLTLQSILLEKDVDKNVFGFRLAASSIVHSNFQTKIVLITD